MTSVASKPATFLFVGHLIFTRRGFTHNTKLQARTPPNYPLGDPKHQLIETARLLKDVPWRILEDKWFCEYVA